MLKEIEKMEIILECDTANKSHNGVVKFRRYYLGKSWLFCIHLRGFNIQFMLVGTKRQLTNVERK